MGIPQLEKVGYEADDLIGTYAVQGSQANLEVLIITGDRDSFQLIDANTTVLFTRRGITELERFDEAHLKEIYQITPQQVIDLKGLMGDASDDIPGIPGVGEKTALKLLLEHGSVEGVLAASSQYAGKKLGEKLVEFADLARLSKQLATIDCQVPLDQQVIEFVPDQGDINEKIRLFRDLEFKTLLEAALQEKVARGGSNVDEASTETPGVPARLLTDWSDLVDYLQDMTEDYFCLLPYGKPLGYGRYQWQIMTIKTPNQPAVYWEFGVSDQDQAFWDILKPYIEDVDLIKVFVDAKIAYLYLTSVGLEPAGVCEDLLLMGYLLDPAKPYHWLVGLENLDFVESAKTSKTATKQGLLMWTPELLNSYLEAMQNLYQVLPQKLTELEMLPLYQMAERPLAPILGLMERQGMLIQPETLVEIGNYLVGKIDQSSAKIFEAAGEVFNLNSPKQLGEILFNKLGLSKGRKTKTGFSTNAETLEYLAQEHEVAREILEYRQYAKLKSTYIDGLLAIMNPLTNRLHSSLNQRITVTGRLSSTEPNLQNIPVRMEEGRQIRKAFIASPGCLLLSGDYSQVELRILAHLSGDLVLQEAFLEGQDIHQRTAAEVFGLSMDQVSSDQRRAAKAVNFGLIYGISDFGLAQDLGISRAEAKDYMDRYFHRYPRVKEFLEQIQVDATEKGYVETVLKRRRYLPELASKNFHTRSFGLRAAMNAPIQGTAADIMKLAMVEVNTVLQRENLAEAMVLQVHDELIFDLPATRIEALQEPIRQAMEQVFQLSVPLKVDLKKGPDWYNMKKC